MKKAILHLSTIVALVAGVANASAATEETATTMAPSVEQCIRENAPKVEKAIASLTDAVDFLVNDVCAVQISEQMGALQQATMKKFYANQKKTCDEKKAAGKSTKVGAGQDSYDFCEMLGSEESTATEFTGWTLYGKQSSPQATALAAKLLLDLRLSHSNSRQSN